LKIAAKVNSETWKNMTLTAYIWKANINRSRLHYDSKNVELELMGSEIHVVTLPANRTMEKLNRSRGHNIMHMTEASAPFEIQIRAAVQSTHGS
jgi:hypothetical protein